MNINGGPKLYQFCKSLWQKVCLNGSLSIRPIHNEVAAFTVAGLADYLTEAITSGALKHNIQEDVKMGNTECTFEGAIRLLMTQFTEQYAEGRMPLHTGTFRFIYDGEKDGVIEYSTDLSYVDINVSKTANEIMEDIIVKEAIKNNKTDLMNAMMSKRRKILMVFYGLHEIGHAHHSDKFTEKEWLITNHEQNLRLNQSAQRLTAIFGNDLDVYKSEFAKAYRKLQKEKYADEFAAKTLVANWDTIKAYI